MNIINYLKIILNKLFVMDGIWKTKKENEKENKILSKLDLKEIILVDFPYNQYVREETKKNQIVLHHTVSGQGVDGDIKWWLMTAERIATALIIQWDGKIFQCFSSKYWAYHLGAGNSNLDKHSIGIEIDSWGGLIEKNGLWYPAKWDDVKKKNIPNTNLKPVENVVIYDKQYRGFYGFEKYTDEQIESLRKLLIFFNEKYDIPLDYNEDMFTYSEKAINGVSGIWSHSSYRQDKSDVHPQKELIELLKSLK